MNKKDVDNRQTACINTKDGVLFEFNYDKNIKLLEEGKIGCERVITLIENGAILDIKEHPNQNKYPGQKIYIIEIDGYCWQVPFIIKDGKRFLKKIIPSRKATRDYLRNNNKEKKND